MARIQPDGWRELSVTGAAQREIATLSRLAQALPDGYTVYHAVHWTLLERGFSVYDEIDYVIVNRAGAMLLIEQKRGFLDETPEGLVKRHGERSRNLPLQMSRAAAEFRRRLAKRPGTAEVAIECLLYCPDYRVKQPDTAGIVAERIVDARRADQLVQTILEILPEAQDAPAALQVHRFLRDVIQLETDTSALVGRAQALVTRLSGGLAHWAGKLVFTPWRLRVIGTAGSGKSQLALAEYRAAIDRGERPLYVCFNRPLADHFAAIVPEGGVVCSFHTLCERRLRDAGETPDFTQPDIFDRLVDGARALPVDERWRFDAVIVDEGQDFSPAWCESVLRHARAHARLLWLEDPMQNLYGREPVALPGWVELHAEENYRSPRAVLEMLRPLLPAGAAMQARGPLQSADLEVLSHDDTDGLLQATTEGITRCLAAGFRRQDIAVVSFRGRETSAILGLAKLGPHALRSFTGRYDLFGQALYGEGEVLAESVYRFKGQAAPAIVFTEIDFDTLDERTVQKLFVGATRASMKLVLVASARARALLPMG